MIYEMKLQVIHFTVNFPYLTSAQMLAMMNWTTT